MNSHFVKRVIQESIPAFRFLLRQKHLEQVFRRVRIEECNGLAENANIRTRAEHDRRIGWILRHEHNLALVLIHATERERMVYLDDGDLVAANVFHDARVDDVPVVDVEFLHAVSGEAKGKIAADALGNLVVAGNVLLVQQRNALDRAIEARLDDGGGQRGDGL